MRIMLKKYNKVKDTNQNYNQTHILIAFRIKFAPDSVIIMICDESGIAIEFVDYFIKRGATNVVLQGTYNFSTDYSKWKIW